jgi:hypothetical protein
MSSLKEPQEDSVWVSIGITKNVGNYESVRLDAGIRKTLGTTDSMEVVWKEAWREVNDQLEEQLQDLKRATSE